jgi:hypothetical protein
LLDHGRTYFVLDDEGQRGFRIANDLMFLGAEVLCISQADPELMEERWYGNHPHFIRLGGSPAGSVVAPDNLSLLGRRISDFVGGRQEAAVLLDGIECLASRNDFNRLQMFVEHLVDIAMDTGSIIIIQTGTRSFDSRSLARLGRFAEMVEPLK